MRGFLEEPRLRLLPPPPLLRRLGRGALPGGRLLPPDDGIISESCDIVPKSVTGGRSTAKHTQVETV